MLVHRCKKVTDWISNIMRMQFCSSIWLPLCLALVGPLHQNSAVFLPASEITMSSWVGTTSFLTHSRTEIQFVLGFPVKIFL